MGAELKIPAGQSCETPPGSIVAAHEESTEDDTTRYSSWAIIRGIVDPPAGGIFLLLGRCCFWKPRLVTLIRRHFAALLLDRLYISSVTNAGMIQ
jgi:hypothetical protein